MFLQIDWTTICPEQKWVDADGAEGEGDPLYSAAERARTRRKWVSEGNPLGQKAGMSKKSWRRRETFTNDVEHQSNFFFFTVLPFWGEFEVQEDKNLWK